MTCGSIRRPLFALVTVTSEQTGVVIQDVPMLLVMGRNVLNNLQFCSTVRFREWREQR
jgi:hypothetical protein